MSSVVPREKGEKASGGCATAMALTEGASTRAVQGCPNATGGTCLVLSVAVQAAWLAGACSAAAKGAAGPAAAEPLVPGVVQALVQAELASTAKLAGSWRAFSERMRASRHSGRAALTGVAPRPAGWQGETR